MYQRYQLDEIEPIMRTEKKFRFEQVVALVSQLSQQDQEKLFLWLKKERIKELLREIRSTENGANISMREITREVESVRKNRKNSQDNREFYIVIPFFHRT